MDADRLAEEKLRGITIDIGFGYYSADKTIIDLPGHEKFIRNMAAGAVTVDFAIMVIAADDGPMPQTYEHLDILNLLGIKHGMTALTKIDLVEEDWLELVTEDIKDKLAGTFLENAPIVRMDSISGRGVDEFKSVFEREIAKLPPRESRSEFRLPVDRAFSIRGFGTVVTGTVLSGKVSLKDSVQMLPAGKIVKVRGIQTQGEEKKEAYPGGRAALNLSGIEKDEISRGDVLCTPGLLKPSKRLDTRISLLKSSLPIKHRQRVRFHIGTSEILGRILLLNENSLNPGEEAFAQLELEETAIALRGDRFVFRTYSPQVTIGGGTVLANAVEKHKRRQKSLNDLLTALYSGDESRIIVQVLNNSGITGMVEEDILAAASIEKQGFRNITDDLIKKGLIIQGKSGGKNWLGCAKMFEEMKKMILETIGEVHAKNPSKPGINIARLKTELSLSTDSPFIEMAAEALIEEKKLKFKDTLFSLNSHSITLNSQQAELCDKMLAMISESGSATLKAHTLTEALGIGIEETIDLIMILEGLGNIIRLNSDTVILRAAFDDVILKLREFEKREGKIIVADANQYIGSGRRSIVAILDYTDKMRITDRDGDVRRFR